MGNYVPTSAAIKHQKHGNREQVEITDFDAKVNTAEMFNFLESCFARVEN